MNIFILFVVLQPASSPYDIKEKVQTANTELFNHNPDLENREIRLKFKEDLVDYEPDTEDDVNSIESYSETVDYSIIEKEILHKQIEENNVLTINTNLFDVPEADIEEEIVEEIGESVLYETKITSNGNYELEEYVESISENEHNFNIAIERPTQNVNNDTLNIPPIKVNSEKRRTNKNYHINCKNHCIERLDIDLDLSINRLHITEKPCPMLKLQPRKCCEKNLIKIEQKLPIYGGYKSEYGLSLEQLEKKERKKEMIKLREQKRQEVLREYKERKVQQNEEIFCQWLKNISKRKRDVETREKKTKKCLTPTVFSFPNKTDDKIKQRPKTAHFQPSHAVKKLKRPHTSTSCVFIEVPRNLLRNGISVGDIFIQNPPIKTNKLHFLSVT